MVQGVIIKALSGFYYVAAGDQIVECKARGRFRYDGCSPLVGDRVEVSFDAHGKGRIDTVLPRRNAFIRPAVANIDQLIMIAANVNPVTDPFLIDRVSPSRKMPTASRSSASISATLTRRIISMLFTAPSAFASCARARRRGSASMSCAMHCAGRPAPSPATPALENRACSMRSMRRSALRPGPSASGSAAVSTQRAMSSSMRLERIRSSPIRRLCLV